MVWLCQNLVDIQNGQRMDGSVLAVLAAFQNNLVTSDDDDVTSGSMSTTPMSEKYDSGCERHV